MFCADSAFMRSCSTPLTPWTLLAELVAVSVPLAFETAEWVRNEYPHCVADVASEEGVWKFGGFESEHEETGVLSLSVTESCQAAYVGNSFRSQTIEDFRLCHEPHLRCEYGTFGAVSCLMK